MKENSKESAFLSISKDGIESNYFGVPSRILEIRKKLGKSRELLSKELNIGKSTLQNYENASREPSFIFLVNLANYANVDLNWLMTGKENEVGKSKPISSELMSDDFVFIPRYDVEASAGYGAYPDSENMLSSMAFRKHWVKNILRINPDRLSVITVRGDSMTPELNDKDIILVHHADNDPKDGIYVLRINGDIIVKRVQKMPDNTLTVISTNTIYREFTIDLETPPEDFEVIGKVIWSAGMII